MECRQQRREVGVDVDAHHRQLRVRRGAFHRDGLARPVAEHPGHGVGQAARMAAVAAAPAEVRHAAGRLACVVLRALGADRGVEQLLAAQHLEREGIGRQRRRGDARDLLVLRRIVARDVDHRHVARHQVHHVGARVVAVDHHALGARVARVAGGIDAHFDAHHVAGVAGGQRRVDRGLAVGVEHQAHQPIGGARQHETFERAARA